MSNVEPFPKSPRTEPLNPRIAAMVSAILTLVDGFGLSAAEQEQVLKEVTEKLRPIAVPRAGDVLNTVVNLIPRDRAWTVREIKDRVEQSGAPVADKELYNAIGYLTRKQHIQRVGTGRYIINGIGLVTGDDMGTQPSITEGDLDD